MPAGVVRQEHDFVAAGARVAAPEHPTRVRYPVISQAEGAGKDGSPQLEAADIQPDRPTVLWVGELRCSPAERVEETGLAGHGGTLHTAGTSLSGPLCTDMHIYALSCTCSQSWAVW